jgi:hypothetical protein
MTLSRHGSVPPGACSEIQSPKDPWCKTHPLRHGKPWRNGDNARKGTLFCLTVDMCWDIRAYIAEHACRNTPQCLSIFVTLRMSGSTKLMQTCEHMGMFAAVGSNSRMSDGNLRGPLSVKGAGKVAPHEPHVRRQVRVTVRYSERFPDL